MNLDQEWAAAGLVVGLHPGIVVHTDVDRPESGRLDFNIEPHGIGLEVTSLTSDGSGVTSQTINSIVEREAIANVAKLKAYPCIERHLFVWIDGTEAEGQASVSGVFDGPPSIPPELPPGIDVVWGALWTPGPTVPTSILWRVRPPDGWEVLPIHYVQLSRQPAQRVGG